MKDEVSFFLGCGVVISAQHFETTVSYQIVGTSVTRWCTAASRKNRP